MSSESYLLDQLQSQRSGLSEDLDADAVTRVFQDQTSDVEPPADKDCVSIEWLFLAMDRRIH